MGRKNKKRGAQPVRTPLRTSATLPPKPEPVQAPAPTPAPEPQPQPEPEPAPLIDVDLPLADEDLDLMPLDTSQQLSPPPSPLPEDLPEPPSPVQDPAPPRPTAPPPPRRKDSFVHIGSPPESPSLPPAGALDARGRLRPQHQSSNTRSSHAPPESYGVNPHVVACVSCNNFCVLTGARGVQDRHKLGLDVENTDTFFPIVCSNCENIRGFLWLSVEGGRSPPGQYYQYPETLNSSMLAAWPLYRAVCKRFGVEFNEKTRQPTATVTRARDWWKEGVLTHDKSLVLMWQYDQERGTMCERTPMPRKDEFFGGPQR